MLIARTRCTELRQAAGARRRAVTLQVRVTGGLFCNRTLRLKDT